MKGKITNTVFCTFLVLIIEVIIVFVLSSPNKPFLAAEAHITSIPVGDGPFGITYIPSNHNIYVANFYSSTVSVINSSSDAVVATILVGDGPNSLIYVPSNNHIYVTNRGSDDVYVIDGANNKVIKAIKVGSKPGGLAYDSTYNRVHVANSNDNTTSVIDAATDSVIANVSLKRGFGPKSLTYNSAVGGIYLTKSPTSSDPNSNLIEVSVINGATNAIVKEVPIGFSQELDEAYAIIYNPANNKIYVATSKVIPVIDGIRNIHIGNILLPGNRSEIYGATYAPTNTNVYMVRSISLPRADELITISPQTTITSTIANCRLASDIVYNPHNDHLYITCGRSDVVTVIHP